MILASSVIPDGGVEIVLSAAAVAVEGATATGIILCSVESVLVGAEGWLVAVESFIILTGNVFGIMP